jgi:hypothetical protein
LLAPLELGALSLASRGVSDASTRDRDRLEHGQREICAGKRAHKAE